MRELFRNMKYRALIYSINRVRLTILIICYAVFLKKTRSGNSKKFLAPTVQTTKRWSRVEDDEQNLKNHQRFLV